MAPLSGTVGESPLKDSGLGQASPLSHVASSDPSPQLSFPSHCWLFRMHFPLAHLTVSAGQSGKHKALSRGSTPERRDGCSAQATPPRALTPRPHEHSLHSSSSLLSPQSFTLSQTQKRGLQNLFLHVNW